MVTNPIVDRSILDVHAGLTNTNMKNGTSKKALSLVPFGAPEMAGTFLTDSTSFMSNTLLQC